MAVPVQIRTLASTFFTWWISELAALWRPIGRLLHRTKRLTLSTSDEQWILRLHKGGRTKELARFEPSKPNEGNNLVIAAVKRLGLRHTELTVLIPRSRTLHRLLDMPLIPEGDLLQALYFEIDRQTPFEPEGVYFDYRIVGRRPEAKRLSVELTVIPKVTVEPILRQVQQWGFRPSIVDVATGGTNDGIGINLMRGLEQSSANPRWPALRWASVLIFLLLIIAVVYLPILQLEDVDELLKAKVTQAGERAKQTLAKREELEQTVRIARFLDERKKEVRVLLILEELTKALPDNTWLTSLSQKKGEIKISGYSARAAELISLIDTVPLFTNPSFSSPIVQDPQNKQERFDISFEIATNGAAK